MSLVLAVSSEETVTSEYSTTQFSNGEDTICSEVEDMLSPMFSPVEVENVAGPSTLTTLIPTSISHQQPKTKKRRIDNDAVIKEASNAIKSIVPSLNAAPAIENNVKSDNEVLANYIVNKLDKITNDNIRMDTEHEIIDMLFNNIEKCKDML